MLLSDLIDRFSDPDFASDAFLALNDLVLTARIAERACGEGLTPGDYVRNAVERYVDAAGEEEWLTLIGLMSRSGDPGGIFLRRALLADAGEGESRPNLAASTAASDLRTS